MSFSNVRHTTTTDEYSQLGRIDAEEDESDGRLPDAAEPNGGVFPDETADGETADEGGGGWWDEEDPDAPWMTQSTRLMPNTTISLWQFTP